jgi:hypothetical protein
VKGNERLSIPEEVLAIARTLEGAGFETWCVGGAVRDNLLDQPNTDFDLATAAPPAEVLRLFRRTVPVGIEHGTIAVLDANNKPHEVTTFRRDVKTDGRHAVVEFGVSLDDDLARRDFTINAIAYHPTRHEWRDPFHGQTDLKAGVVRAVGDPRQRFREDYLRILRALRFAARFGFTIEPATFAAAKAEADGLKGLSAERVRDEWFKGIRTARTVSGLVTGWLEVGAMQRWIPEMREGVNPQNPKLPLGVGSGGALANPGNPRLPPGVGLVDAVDRLGNDPVLITAYLSADPATTLARLRCSNAEIERGRRIGKGRGKWPDAAKPVSVRRWMSEVGSAVDDLVAVLSADGAGDALAAAVAQVRSAKAPLSLGDLAITGDDLMQAGVPRGPAVGTTLRALLERVLDDPAVNTKERLLALAVTLPASRPSPP